MAFPKYDVDLYQSLIGRVALDLSFFRGTFQDLSSAKRTMTNPFGCTFKDVGGCEWIMSAKNGEVRTSAAVAPVVDYEAPYTIEVMFQTASGLPYAYYQVNNGGCQLRHLSATGQLSVNSFGGGLAIKALTSPAGSAPLGSRIHAILSFSPQGPTGLIWINGMPVVAAGASSGATQPCNNDIVYTLDANRDSLVKYAILRVWSGLLGNADAAALFGASQNLVSG